MILASVALSVGFLAGRASGEAAAPDPAARTYVVQAGDTLWRIARAEVGDAADPRPFVERIAQLNGLDGARLEPGSELVLPESS